jgi:hypothetical protein
MSIGREFKQAIYKKYHCSNLLRTYYYIDHPLFSECNNAAKVELSHFVLDDDGTVLKCNQGLEYLLDNYFGITHD